MHILDAYMGVPLKLKLAGKFPAKKYTFGGNFKNNKMSSPILPHQSTQTCTPLASTGDAYA
jgi:hypothetical protein